MKTNEIVSYRLINQSIAESDLKTPAEVVSSLCAMQAQEWAMAKWAIGLRLPGATNLSVEKAFNEGAILRTHLMRPTWHFVSPMDIRWLLQLTAPRVHALNAFYYRKTGLDKTKLNRSTNLLAKTLQGQKYLTREALKPALAPIKLSGDGVQLSCIMMYAELEGVICSGPRIGKQFSYALLEERVPAVKALSKKEALAEFSKRYFRSRGPASLQDFSNWSGLTIKEVREGTNMIMSMLIKEKWQDLEYFRMPTELKDLRNLQTTFLMPDYDEIGMSYKNREAMIDPKAKTMNDLIKYDSFSHMIIVDGKVLGTWQRIEKGKKLSVETKFFIPLSQAKQNAVGKAIKKYVEFFGGT